MNTGQHFGSINDIISSLNWLKTDNSNLIRYIQVFNWLTDYFSFVDILGYKIYLIGLLDYFPFSLPIIGKGMRNFFQMNNMIKINYSKFLIGQNKKFYHELHFDNLQNLNQINNHWFKLKQLTIKELSDINTIKNKTEKKIKLLIIIGQTLHAVQDFYSHSNWIEYFHEKHNFNNKESFMTWFDVFKNNKQKYDEYKKLLLKNEEEIYTGYFPANKNISKYNIVHDDKKRMPGLNKDRAERPYFDVVYHLSVKQGIQWLNYLRDNDYLNSNHLELLKENMNELLHDNLTSIHNFGKNLTFNLKEWNNSGPFNNLKIKLSSVKTLKENLFINVQFSADENLINLDRDFRKAYFILRIYSITENQLLFEKFISTCKNGTSSVKINLKNYKKQNYYSKIKIEANCGLIKDFIEYRVNK